MDESSNRKSRQKGRNGVAEKLVSKINGSGTGKRIGNFGVVEQLVSRLTTSSQTRALCSSVDQTYERYDGLFVGIFGRLFAASSWLFQVGNLGNQPFEIYVFMLIFWKAIDRLNSVRDLHELLVKVFGAGRIGDQKRIEKICQRIGLSFRKAGRPRK